MLFILYDVGGGIERQEDKVSDIKEDEDTQEEDIDASAAFTDAGLSTSSGSSTEARVTSDIFVARPACVLFLCAFLTAAKIV